ncbi:MAG: Maf family nucleotide pyrophosphatase [Bifidobacterium psychraerophilum]|uniref:Maf family nucleotide pyrophosphatase n=1 Tax=Bifidobacterium psychraerophilum TaxID=218140 RepID=UPI0039E9CF34
MSIPLILASKSRPRRDLLYGAGICPTIRESHVDEDAALASTAKERGIDAQMMPAEERVATLAREKALAVAQSFGAVARTASEAQGDLQISYPLKDGYGSISKVTPIQDAINAHNGLTSASVGPLVIGCDSMFSLDGVVYGKPHSEENARERLRQMRGKTGTLWTGHCLIDVASGRELHAVSHSQVSFGDFTDEDIEDYIATKEPLEVAGSFTLEGFGSAFISGIQGDPSGVIGLSLPTLRTLVESLGIRWTQLWNLSREQKQGTNPDNPDAPSSNVHQPGDGWIDCACGHRHWGLNGASGVLLARRDQESGRITDVLLQHRALWSAEGGTWGAPGGATADGESPLEGALRESFEEANIQPEDIRVVGSYREDHGPWGYATVFAFEKPGHQVQPQANDDESMSVEWVPFDKVAQYKLISPLQRDWPEFEERLKSLAAQDRPQR